MSRAMYKVGDLVRILPYQELTTLLGRTAYGDIRVPSGWNDYMTDYCGKSFVVESVHNRGDGDWFYYLDDTDGWSWDECVLDPAFTNFEEANPIITTSYDSLFS